eukprot:4399954-Amphidinium_carterae.1
MPAVMELLPHLDLEVGFRSSSVLRRCPLTLDPNVSSSSTLDLYSLHPCVSCEVRCMALCSHSVRTSRCQTFQSRIGASSPVNRLPAFPYHSASPLGELTGSTR